MKINTCTLSITHKSWVMHSSSLIKWWLIDSLVTPSYPQLHISIPLLWKQLDTLLQFLSFGEHTVFSSFLRAEGKWEVKTEAGRAVPVTVPWWALSGWPFPSHGKAVQRLPSASVSVCQVPLAYPSPRTGYWEDEAAQQGLCIERPPFKITYG